MRGALLALHRRLLPPDPDVGWVPYLWIVYLLPFLLTPFLRPSSALETAGTLAVSLGFLALYFRGYWLEGRKIVPIVAAIVLLGVVSLPWNRGAVAFFVYAAAFAGRAGPPRHGVRILVAILLVVAVEAVLGPPDMRPTLAFMAVIAVLIGLVNVYYEELARKRQALRVSEEELKRVAAAAERERIGRDLHDLLGHTLSVIALKSELAARLVDRSPERAGVEIRDVERISREALAQVRAAVAGYRAASLPAEIANARLALRAADVTFEAAVEGPALPPDVDAVLAMILREAVTNVVRHANARRCEASVHAGDESVVLRVRDDGRGGPFRERSGVAGMRERVVERGGTFEIRGEGGTEIVVTLPLREPDAGRARESA